MGNIYGVANAIALPASYGTIGAVDVAVSAGTETNVISSGAITGPNPGDYFPWIDGVLAIYLGATAPTALVIAFRLGAGSDVASLTWDPGQLVNAAKIIVPFGFLGANSGSAWVGSGSTVNITVNATGQAVTVKNVGSYARVALIRGPDA